jgi:hypothetical protein
MALGRPPLLFSPSTNRPSSTRPDEPNLLLLEKIVSCLTNFFYLVKHFRGLAHFQFFKSSRDEKVGTTQADLPIGSQASFQKFRTRST